MRKITATERNLGLATIISSGILIWNKVILDVSLEIHQIITVISGAILIIALPYLFIEGVFKTLKRKNTKGSIECGGLASGGSLIGSSERLLIFIAFMIASYESSLSYTAIMNFLSIIVAGKAIFRYSIGTNQGANTRACADWYIIGTFMSLIWGLLVAWIVFNFLMVG